MVPIAQRWPVNFGISVCFLNLISSNAFAVDITIANGQEVTTTQSSTANGDVITVEGGGTINVNGINGVEVGDVDVTVNNAGTIITTGNTADGISITGDDAIITNNGSITTTGNDSDGVFFIGADNIIITNNGSISVTGDTSAGLAGTGNNPNITNNGSIFVVGNTSAGIDTSGTNANISNSGSIFVTGTGSFGIAGLGPDANIINSGSIQAAGTNSIAVNLDQFGGDNSTLTNTGLISATNAASAIIGGTGSQTLNLGVGSRIFGNIDLGGGTDVVNILGTFPSAQLTFVGVETINIASGVAAITDGTTTVTTLDGTGDAIRSTNLSSFTNGIHNVVNLRMSQTNPLKPVQVASLDLTSDMLFQTREPVIWGEVFAASRDRETDGNVQHYDHEYIGFTGGYEQDFRRARVGVLAGYAFSDTETRVASIDTNTNSLFAGIYGHYHLGSINFTAVLIGGYEDHDNNRFVFDNLIGIETASSDFDSYFISPSLTLSSGFKTSENTEIRPSASIAYTASWYDDYSESGSTSSNLTIQDRSSNVLNTRLQLAGVYTPSNIAEIQLRGGLKSRHVDDDDVAASLAGANFRFSSTADENIFGGFLGGNLRVAIKDRLTLNTGFEYALMQGSENEVAARLSLDFLF